MADDRVVYLCDVSDAALKDIMPQMEHPFYAISKTPDTAIRRYEHGGNWVEITPSVKGIATIYDKDILIYAISQMVAKMQTGEPLTPWVEINTAEMLRFIGRGTGGRDYQSVIDALDRLEGTRFRTNIQTGNIVQSEGFGLIDASSVDRVNGLDGRLLSCKLKLSQWLMNAISGYEVLTLHQDYFKISRPIDRRLYEIARKHCGNQSIWRIRLETLQLKVGAKTAMRNFRLMIRRVQAEDTIPEYQLAINDDDMVTFTPKADAVRHHKPVDMTIDADTRQEAKDAAPGWDVDYLEQEWRDWVFRSAKPLTNPPRHFVKFCETWAKKHKLL
jgi:plasmid replication initiation protein